MNCPRCSAELLDSALSCPRCGFQGRPASFSYVPAGSPPWPTTVPQSFSYVTGAGSQTTQTAKPMQQTANIPAAESARASRKSTLGIPSIIALFFISILVGGGATLAILFTSGRFPSNANNQPSRPVTLQQTPGAGFAPTPSVGTPGSQLPTPTSFLAINSNDLGVSLKYPGGWIAGSPQKTTSGNTSIEIHPQQLPIDFIVGRISATNSAQIGSTSDINQATLTQFQGAQGINNFQIVQPSSPKRKIGGAQWDEQDATFDNQAGVTLHLTTVTVQHNKLYYTMFFYVPDTNYTEAIHKYFQPMFDSFKFLS
jgi:hypothetical protein